MPTFQSGYMSWSQHAMFAAATALGSYGGFPDPPYVIKRLAGYPFFKWFLLFVLIWQGGGSRSSDDFSDMTVSVLIVLAFVVGKFALDFLFPGPRDASPPALTTG